MLWATGCSHTYGDDLEDESSAWPYLLAKKLGMSCNNNAVSGGSNERVLYESVKSNTSDLAVIAWTYKERFTRYDNSNNFSSSWLEFNNNIKDLVCFDVMNDEQLYQEHIEIQKYIAEIDMACYYSINNFHITDLHLQYPVGDTGHLLDEGHQHLADRLYDCLK